VANSDGGVTVLLGDGRGGFAGPVNHKVGLSPVGLVIEDFDADGKRDLAVANNMTGDVSILLGDGKGGFGKAAAFAVGAEPVAITAGDFNGDGKTDLATINPKQLNMKVLMGDGRGAFGKPTAVVAERTARSLVAGDFNGDGRSDLAFATDALNNVAVLLADAGGGFAERKYYPVGGRPFWIEVADFDGDGKADAALANGIGQLAVHRGNGDGTFGQAEIFSLPGDNSNVQLAVGDLSGEGMPDIVVGERHGAGTVGTLSVLINGNAPPNADNAPPQTKIVKEPANKTSKAKAKYKFKSTEPNSTFECKFDKKKLKSCKSPAKYSVDDGKHKFAVQATDAAGNTDPSPAKDKFKVVDD
jgi:FG-GAP-like repeat